MTNEFHIHGNNNTIIVQQTLRQENLILDNKLSSAKTKFDWKEFFNLLLKVVSRILKFIVIPVFLNSV